MRKIEEEEYVRTFNGLIGQVVQITDYGYAIRIYNGAEYVVRAVIKKHSKNLIDLIEEGDIINNNLIVYKGRTASGKEKCLVGNHIIHGMSLRITDVKTILTHELYEQNCYKIERS